MRILFLATWFPYPPDNGARIRTYYLVKALSKAHDVHLLSLLRDDSDPQNADKLLDICSVVSLHKSRWFKPGTIKSIFGFFSPQPRSIIDTYNHEIRRSVEQALDEIKPDMIIASYLDIAVYVPNKLPIPCVLDEHNCEYAVLRRNAESIKNPFHRLRYKLGWKKFARWESSMCRRFSRVVTVSDTDRQCLLEAAPDLCNIDVIPNGVDTDRYDAASWAPMHGSLIYNGALTYGANLDAVRYYADQIYPLLSEDVPEIELRVTGRYDNVDLNGLANCPGIKLTGYVDDIRPELAKSSVCIVPLRQGGGSRLKILEAMAAGVPVVSTSIGVEGLDVTDRVHLLIADSPIEFAEAVSTIINDRNLAAGLSKNARQLVEEKYDWSAIGSAFSSIVESVFDCNTKHFCL